MKTINIDNIWFQLFDFYMIELRSIILRKDYLRKSFERDA